MGAAVLRKKFSAPVRILAACIHRVLVMLLLLIGCRSAGATEPAWVALVASGQLVDVRKYDPTIAVEMRYATAHNCVGAAIYPPDFPCLTRPETAVRLHLVQRMLRNWGYRLKIWDAYRPLEAQKILYARWAGKGYVADPNEGGGSLHTWGLAVDATMVDLIGREVSMPSGFAGAIYQGGDAKAAFHLHLLQSAMGAAGFMGVRNEWWHFAVKDWAKHTPLSGPGEPKASDAKPADAPNLITEPVSVPGKPSANASEQRSATPPR